MYLWYIDPGTGSMLFTILITVVGSVIYLCKNLFVKFKMKASGGKKQESSQRIPIAIFSDSKRYWNIFEPICDEFEKRGKPIHYMTASPDDPALAKAYEHVTCEFIGEGNRAFGKLNFLSADILFSTTPGLDVYQWKRSRDVSWYVHIPHASSDITLYRMFGIDYYDAVLLSGQYQVDDIRALEKLRNLPEKELKIVGIPYMDEMRKRLIQAPPLGEHEKTVLVAPSWGTSGILSCYGGKIIDALKNTGYHIIIRPHPQSFVSEKELMDKLMAEYPESDMLEWNRDNDNFDVLYRSDILISDFSGVIFDYALIYNKPVIYADTHFDKSPYDCCWLDKELWCFEILSQIGIPLSESEFPEIKQVIDNCIENPAFARGRDKARSETWEHIGEGAVNVVNYLLDTYDRLMQESESTVTEEAEETGVIVEA